MFFKSEEKTQKPATYTILNNRFAMKVPPDGEDRSFYRFAGPVEDEVTHNIIFTIENNLEFSDLE